MKKLSLKKTTLSRLNNEVLLNVKGGGNDGSPDKDHDIKTWGDTCVFAETQGCTTEGNGCKTEITQCYC